MLESPQTKLEQPFINLSKIASLYQFLLLINKLMREGKRQKINLLTQVQFYKNYSQHRQRLDNRYRSPIQIKKSMSFDPQKTKFANYIKQRKQYTKQFNKKSNKTETKDSIMLRKILQYNQKLFIFSVKSEIPKDGRLHHNAKVNYNKTNREVDFENAKIFHRIQKAKAKSVYNQQYLNKSRFSNICKTSLLRKTNSNIQLHQTMRNPSSQKMYTEYHQQEQHSQNEQRVSQASQFSNPSEVRRFLQDDNIKQQPPELQFKRSNYQPPNIDLDSNKKSICDRVRKERLAVKLYEKKMKFQNTIFSRIISNRK